VEKAIAPNFFVKWKGYADKHNSWITEGDFVDKKPLRAYWQTQAQERNAGADSQGNAENGRKRRTAQQRAYSLRKRQRR